MSIPFGIPFIGLGAILLWVCVYFWREGKDFREGPLQARATITSKFRKPGDPYLFGLENYFVTADFVDAQQVHRTVEIRVPSRQWHFLRVGGQESMISLHSNPSRARVVSLAAQGIISGIQLFGMAIGSLFIGFGILFMVTGVSPGSGEAAVSEPAPTKFDKDGVSQSSLMVSAAHDRAAVLDEKGNQLTLRQLPSGTLAGSTRGHGWRLLSWSPDGAQLAVAEGPAVVVLDAGSLQPVAGATYSWKRESAALAASCPLAAQVWDSTGARVAAACGKNVMVVDGSAVRLLPHRDRVLSVAWSPSGHRLASVSDDNYVRVWDATAQKCIGVSEDYPYPRAAYFIDENTVTVIDVAMRQYTMRVGR